MQLEINESHKKANLTGLNKPFKTIATSVVIPTVIFAYSGSFFDMEKIMIDIKKTNKKSKKR